MESFKDKTGFEWKLPEIDVGLVRRVKRETGVDFFGDDSRGSTARDDAENWFVLLFDPERLVAVLWVLLEDEVEKQKLDTDGFAGRLNKAALTDARKAVVEALMSFTHTPAVAAAVQAELPGITAKLETAWIARLRNTVSGSAASSASTPAASA